MSDQDHQRRQRFPIGILLVGIVVLSPILTFPMGPDHGAFLRGGLTILNGGTLYADFIDVKPPLIYELHALSAALFGVTEQSVRILDMLWQCGTLVALLWLLQTVSASRMWQWCSTVTYALLYTTLNFSQTAQVESYVALPLLLMTGLWMNGHSKWRDVLIGVCLGVLFLLKYTFAGVAFVFIAFDLLHLKEHNNTTTASLVNLTKRSLWILLGFTFFVLCSSIPLFLYSSILPVLSYLRVYSAHPVLSLDLLRVAIKSMGIEAGDFISLAISVGSIAGLASILKRGIGEKHRALLEMSALLVVALLLTVILERKFPPYHYSRIYMPLAILAGYGFAFAIQFVRERMKGAGLRTAVVIAIVLIVATALSPLPRYINIAAVAARSLTQPDVYDAYLTRPDGGGMNFKTFRSLQHRMNGLVKPHESVMFMTIEASMIVPFVHSAIPNAFADSHLYFGVGVPDEWRTKALQQLKGSQWLVVDTADLAGAVNLHSRTSMQSLEIDPLLGPEFRSGFTLFDSIDVYRIYQRTTP